MWPLHVGQVHTTRQRPERDGLVESDDDADLGPQRGFRLTARDAGELDGRLRTPPDLAASPAGLPIVAYLGGWLLAGREPRR